MKLHFNKLWFTCLILILALGVLAFAAGEQDEKFTIGHPKVRKVMELQHAATPVLMSMEDVLGTAVGQDDDGEATLLIYMNLEGKNPAKNARQIPSDIAGTRVSVQFTEPFVAMGSKPGGGVSHTAKQATPIQLGTSGGGRLDSANGYCCGGTLGSLVQVNGIKYILSNYHVFESDIVTGGNGRVATTGDYVIQPGLIDVGCNAAGAQNVGRLVTIQSLPSSNVDASVAQVISGMVNSSGAILEIGTISATTVSASLNQGVKKSGRTTGLSRSKVTGLNGTISVRYDNECAGGTAFTKTFAGQIIISNQSRRFLNSGDSGSLMVEDVASSPRAIGLLYAGSSSTAVANPIGEVLTFIGSKLGGTATMVGGN